jgi:TonB family protein
MALTGQLSDMSLAELIEFFCNQRKTGRLKIDYPRGHSVFFIKEGELVDAKVGALSGPEAVYFSLTLPNAAFDFSPDVQATRRTIQQAWTQVVLEGLRRLDEGVSPTEADAFGKWEPSETELAQMLDQVEHLEARAQSKPARGKERAARAAATRNEEPAAKESPATENTPEPFSTMVESAGGDGGSKKKFVLLGVAAAVVLACTVAAVPLLNRAPAKAATEAAAPTSAAPAAPAAPAPAEAQPAEASADASAVPSAESNPDAAAADARREERDRKERERRRREEAAKKGEAASTLDAAEAPKPATPSGPKSVRVTVTYDEAGRVTAASVAGATPGAEAYGSTAVRVARGRRFPAGKPGSTVVTIPVN